MVTYLQLQGRHLKVEGFFFLPTTGIISQNEIKDLRITVLESYQEWSLKHEQELAQRGGRTFQTTRIDIKVWVFQVVE
jgi:hypothetical protein